MPHVTMRLGRRRVGNAVPEAAEPNVMSGSDAAGHRRWKRHHVWVAVAVLLVVGGSVGAVSAAHSVARHQAQESQRVFDRSSAEVASTLQLAIQHEEDLVVNSSAFLIANPSASEADFRSWADLVHMLGRYPEILGLGYAVIVPAAQLRAFAARAVADPIGTLSTDGMFNVVPPGARPFYCLGSVGISRDTGPGIPAGLDYCATGPVSVARDSGQGSYSPFQVGNTTSLAIETPVYRGGSVPKTVAARREAFQGWVGLLVSPTVLLDRALQGHPDTAVTFRYHQGSSDVAFSSGTAALGSRSVTIDLNNGWTVGTAGAVAGAGIFANETASSLLVVGLALSVLLGALVLLLGTGRARALRLVDERTGELRYQALHDALTGLPNRALIMDRIEQQLARDRRHGTSGAAFFVDLDEFKNVNDTLGHEAGDRLLVAVAARLTSTLRDADTIGRMGGDEFVVLIDGGSLEVAPELVAARLLDVMRQPFELTEASMPLVVSISIGIAMGDRATAGHLLRDADVALYQAKAAGKNRYEIFHPHMQTSISRRLDLEFDLRSALEGEQFRLVYQPIYNLGDLSLVGVEALLRWDHPSLGPVLPDEFIPILEQSGQIREVGRWVLLRACEQMAAWHARGDNLDISVNVSGRQLDHDSLVRDIRDALLTSELPPTSLIIEVTETALMRNAEATALRLQTIKELGVRIAVDDFGTGYSSLAYLRQFPVDCLKIDRMFTNAITSSPESRALVGTLVQLGRDLGLTTLAEGVETTNEMDLLRDADVNQAQGFLLARPLDPATLETQLLTPTEDTAGRPP
jgi:diguanylate cyclase (GGDEF)-like protein